jgi:hypothetical protein
MLPVVVALNALKSIVLGAQPQYAGRATLPVGFARVTWRGGNSTANGRILG